MALSDKGLGHQILKGLSYLGKWIAKRSTEGMETMQCYERYRSFAFKHIYAVFFSFRTVLQRVAHFQIFSFTAEDS